MRIALLSDVHSNVVALEAVLRDVKKHNPDRIISLGDQINLGPCPRETLDLLKAEDVTCLHGNHERYVLSAMVGHPGYRGANFGSVHFHAKMLTREEITFPKELYIEGITLCHAFPGDDRFTVYDTDAAIPLLLEKKIDKPTHIICGHGHNPTHISIPNLRIDSIGSVGCMDDAPPGIAPYAILTIKHGCTGLRPYYAQYDVNRIKPLFISGGMAQAEPVIAHIACLQMTTNTDVIVPFVNAAQSLSKSRGEDFITPETWNDADRTYPWADGMTSREFWKTT